MAYLAIARKWRPQRFDEMVGQGHVTRTLKNAIELGRVHHAFLFTGARGVGKTTAARILAKSLNCEKGPTSTPCNECTNCQEITAGTNRDVHEIDAASNTGVDSVREIRDNLRYLPASGKHKIYIIDEVHMLSVPAFNALLKTLEEPPPHVVFIFATTDPQKVPDTILSRCQRFDFKRIPLKSISEKLEQIASSEGVGVSNASLLMISREAEGSMRDAQSLLDQVISSSGTEVSDEEVVEILGLIDRRLIFDCAAGILEHTAETCLEVIEKIYGFGFDMKQFARELLEIIRHLNAVKVSKSPERFVDVSAEELDRMREMAAKVSREELSRYFSIMIEGYDLVARSESPRLVLEMTVLRMTQVRPVKPLDELVSRLNLLENVARSAGRGGGRPGGIGGGGRPAPGGYSSPAQGGAPGSRRFGASAEASGASPSGGRAASTATGPVSTSEERPVGGVAGTAEARQGGGVAGNVEAKQGDGVAGNVEAKQADASPASDSTPAAAVSSKPAPLPRKASEAASITAVQGERVGGTVESKSLASDSATSPSNSSQGSPPATGSEATTSAADGSTSNSRAKLSRPAASFSERLRAKPLPRQANTEKNASGDTSAKDGGATRLEAPLQPITLPKEVGPWIKFLDFWSNQADETSRPKYLRDAKPVLEDDEHIVIGFRNRMLLERAQEEIASTEARAIIEKFFSSPLRIECVEKSESDALSYHAWVEAKEGLRLDSLRREALKAPSALLVQKVLQVESSDIRVEIKKLQTA